MRCWRIAARRPRGPATRVARSRLPHSTSSPARPADPERAGREVHPVEEQRESPRRGLRGVTGEAGHEQRRRPREGDADDREELRDRALLSLGTIDPDRSDRGSDEEREADPEIDVAAPERGDADERNKRAEREERTKREVCGRQQEVDRDRDEAEQLQRSQKAIETRPQRGDPSTRRITGRAIASRSAASPIAPMTERKTSQRAISSAGSRRSPRSTGSRTAGRARRSVRPRT